MKKMLILVLAILICLPTAFARKSKSKSGDIENNIYTDATYNFQLTLPESWKAKLHDPKDITRLELEQQNHKIPPELMQFPQMARVPTLEIFVVDEAMNPADLLDSITSKSYKADLKKEIMMEVAVLEEHVTFEGFEKDQKNALEIGGLRGSQWIGRTEYIKDLGMGDHIPRTYAMAFVAIQKDKNIIVFSLICELMYRGEIFAEVYKIAESIKW